MSNFNHYPDMDHDGDHDLKDAGMFHNMMEEEEQGNGSGSVGCAPLFVIGLVSIIYIILMIVA